MAPRPPEHGRPVVAVISRKQLMCGGERRAVQALGAGEIEIGFVDRGHFHDGRIFREDCGDAIAPLAVEIVVAVEKNGLRAKLRGGAQRHGGMNAETARLVAGGGNDAALVALPADDHRLAAQLRAREQFDGDEERVHIDVKDRRRCESRRRPRSGDRAWRGNGPASAWRLEYSCAESSKMREVVNLWTSCDGRRLQVRASAEMTRGMPARSLVMLDVGPVLVARENILRDTWSRRVVAELEDQNSTPAQAGRACSIRRAYISMPVGPPKSAA